MGEVLNAPLDVLLPGGDVAQPDLIFVSTAKACIVQDRIRGVPDLLVEILSPDSIEHDRIVKKSLYARSGVTEYWIVDPAEESVEVLSLRGGHYDAAGYFEKTDTLNSPLVPGFSLLLRPIFE